MTNNNFEENRKEIEELEELSNEIDKSGLTPNEYLEKYRGCEFEKVDSPLKDHKAVKIITPEKK